MTIKIWQFSCVVSPLIKRVLQTCLACCRGLYASRGRVVFCNHPDIVLWPFQITFPLYLHFPVCSNIVQLHQSPFWKCTLYPLNPKPWISVIIGFCKIWDAVKNVGHLTLWLLHACATVSTHFFLRQAKYRNFVTVSLFQVQRHQSSKFGITFHPLQLASTTLPQNFWILSLSPDQASPFLRPSHSYCCLCCLHGEPVVEVIHSSSNS